ncbi:hypothetical protein [Bacillus sp. OV166]|uniref:hypothetical protein n=1 Tax=Bacillus sp. OV166 TaxID=1882763 RepID=UPI00211B0EB5|nr:hypothetical protein [Bacillus sp. OV166]
MEILVFLKGLVIGFSIAAPVGPIGVLVIKRTFGEYMVLCRELGQQVRMQFMDLLQGLV